MATGSTESETEDSDVGRLQGEQLQLFERILHVHNRNRSWFLKQCQKCS